MKQFTRNGRGMGEEKEREKIRKKFNKAKDVEKVRIGNTTEGQNVMKRKKEKKEKLYNKKMRKRRERKKKKKETKKKEKL